MVTTAQGLLVTPDEHADVDVHAPPTSDQLAYLADMISELRQMASRAGLSTLTSILSSAEIEALHQARGRLL